MYPLSPASKNKWEAWGWVLKSSREERQWHLSTSNLFILLFWNLGTVLMGSLFALKLFLSGVEGVERRVGWGSVKCPLVTIFGWTWRPQGMVYGGHLWGLGLESQGKRGWRCLDSQLRDLSCRPEGCWAGDCPRRVWFERGGLWEPDTLFQAASSSHAWPGGFSVCLDSARWKVVIMLIRTIFSLGGEGCLFFCLFFFFFFFC